MKDTYLEGAQQEVFAEAKVSKVKYKPSPMWMAKAAKTAAQSFFNTFAEHSEDFDGNEIKIINPAKFQKIVELFAMEALGDAIEQYFDDERNFEALEQFVEECISKKACTKTSSDED